MMKKVSIIIPVYNTGELLNRCLETIIGQSYRNLEIILVNDGSKDNSGELCDQWAAQDSRVIVIHQPNKGVSAARNAGLDIATGDYITFSDSDDAMDNDMIELLVRNAEKNDADISACSVRRLNQDGRIEYRFGTNRCFLWNKIEAITAIMNGKDIVISVDTKLFSKDIASSIRFVEGRKMNEDLFFVFEGFLKAERVYYQDVCKYEYIKRENSCSTARFSDAYFDIIYFADSISSIITDNIPKLKNLALIRELSTRISVYTKIKIDSDASKAYSLQAKKIRDEICNTRYTELKINMKLRVQFFLIKHLPDFYGVFAKIMR